MDRASNYPGIQGRLNDSCWDYCRRRWQEGDLICLFRNPDGTRDLRYCPPPAPPRPSPPEIPRPLYACFNGSTLISTPEEPQRIDSLAAGDEVVTFDVEMKSVRTNIIDRVLSTWVERVFILRIEDDEIEVTGEHPFYVVGEGWSRVSSLNVGDELLRRDRTVAAISGIRIDRKRIQVFNISVAGQRNYFAGHGEYLVHNK